MIRLSEPVTLPAHAYGQLPAVGSLDALQPRQSTTFTSVGYGAQRVNPAQVITDLVRRFAEPRTA